MVLQRRRVASRLFSSFHGNVQVRLDVGLGHVVPAGAAVLRACCRAPPDGLRGAISKEFGSLAWYVPPWPVLRRTQYSRAVICVLRSTHQRGATCIEQPSLP